MQNYKNKFIEFCLNNKIIQFGEFTLKSGRISPYFFNTGLIASGKVISQLGNFYATAIKNSGIDYDILFGPAYKGISLVVTTAIALFELYNIDKKFCFNRKTIKDHAEGGKLIGADLIKGKVLILDDVITAGTAINEAASIIQENHAKISGICVALDRQEKGLDQQAAIQKIEQNYRTNIISIITLQDLFNYTKNHNLSIFNKYATQIELYQAQYCNFPTNSSKE